MDRILDKARAGQNALETLMNMVPGFGGYREKELRRDADRAQREFLASRLEQKKKALDDLGLAATREGRLDAINDIETARKRLDKVVARIRWADRGYAGFFDTVKVDEAVLERVYQFDLALLDSVEAVHQATDVKAAIAALDAMDQRLHDREAILSGAK